MFGLAGCWTTIRCQFRHEKCPAFFNNTKTTFNKCLVWQDVGPRAAIESDTRSAQLLDRGPQPWNSHLHQAPLHANHLLCPFSISQNQLLIEEQTSFCCRCPKTITTSLRRTFRGCGGGGGAFRLRISFKIFLAG